MAYAPGPLHRARRALIDGRVSARQLVEHSLTTIEETQSSLNVAVALDTDSALVAADAYDSEPTGDPLGGLPILVKDLEDVRGFPTRKGSRAFRDAPLALNDAPVPSRYRSAGAIIVGKSTLPEFAIEGFTASALTGITRNPWNPDFSPGGSSGGSAAALAAGLVLAATATDGGGSVRIPASFCGLLGLKPTNGVIGRWPAPDWIDFSTDGILATSSDDLRLLFNLARGPIAGDPSSWSLDSQWEVSAPGRIVATERTSPLGPLPLDVAHCFREAVCTFAGVFGGVPEWREPASFFFDGDPDIDWFTIATAEHVNALGHAFINEHFDHFDASTQAFLETGRSIQLDTYLNAKRRRFSYTRVLDELLGHDGLLLTPTVAAEGWRADGRLTADGNVSLLPAEVYSTALQNVTGHPALNLPCGTLPSGIPFGLQVTAPRFADEWLLDIAARWQQHSPWPEYAPGYAGFDDLLGA